MCSRAVDAAKSRETSVAKGSSGRFSGTRGNPQDSLDLGSGSTGAAKPTYVPSPKHDAPHNWGSPNPIKSQAEGQRLLDTGYRDGRQVYNVTADGKIVKFQPDGTPKRGYHSYEVTSQRDIPAAILRRMLADGKITKTIYGKILRNKL